MLRVAIDARRLRRQKTGVANHIYYLIKGLLEGGHECVIFAPSDHALPTFPLEDRLTIIRVPGDITVSLKRYAVENVLFPHLLQHENIDLFHAPDSLGVPRLPVPVVLTVHDLIPLHTGEYLNWFTKQLYRHSIQQSVSRADYIITISKYSKQELIRYLGVSPSRISVVYNGFSVVQDNHVHSTDFDFPLPEQFILYVGGLGPRKNIVRMLKAYALFRQKHPDAPPLLLTGALKPDIVQQIREYRTLITQLELTNVVKLTGFLTDEQLTFLRKRAFFAVYVSTFEGFGLPILEAMYEGVPVITGNVTAMPEIAGDAALLADPYDPYDIAFNMDLLYQHESLRKDLSEKGKKRATCFSWEMMTQQTIEVYQRITEAFATQSTRAKDILPETLTEFPVS